jgi:hypothetical protein
MGAPIGNQNAKNGAEWRQALRRAMAHRGEGDYRNTLLKIADGVIEKALEGDKDAWREVAEREDGKAAQTTILQGDDEGGPVRLEKIERVIVDPANPDT